MAWSNAFGALAPNSLVVQSDQEILDPMRQKIADMAAWSAPTFEQNFLGAAPGLAASTGLTQEGARGYIGGANSGYASPDDQAFYQAALSRMAPAAGIMDFYNYNQQGAQDQHSNAMADAQKALTNKTDELTQNTQRQTGAYGQMQGGNYFGGMLNEGYSSPAGGAPSTMGGLGGLGGMPTSETNPFAAYNATWTPDAKQQRAGSWGTPFGGW